MPEREEAEAAVRAQDEFLSIASHELRTPVASVKATAQLVQRSLRRGTLDPERAEYYLAISRQLIEAHRGRIWATSPGEHQGTTVGIWLPDPVSPEVPATTPD